MNRLSKIIIRPRSTFPCPLETGEAAAAAEEVEDEEDDGEDGDEEEDEEEDGPEDPSFFLCMAKFSPARNKETKLYKLDKQSKRSYEKKWSYSKLKLSNLPIIF